MQYGSKVTGNLTPIHFETLGPDETFLSEPGVVYEFQVDTEPFNNHEEAIAQLLTLEEQVPDFRITYIETCPKGKIWIQAVDTGPDPWEIGGILANIPFILGLLGVGVLLIAVYTVWSTAPSWLWPIIAGGLVLIFVTKVVPWRALPTPTKVRRKEEKTEAEQTDIEKRRASELYQKRQAVQGRVTSLSSEVVGVQDRIRVLTAKKTLTPREDKLLKDSIKKEKKLSKELKTAREDLKKLA